MTSGQAAPCPLRPPAALDAHTPPHKCPEPPAAPFAVQKGHLWLATSAPDGSAWRAALCARGFRPQAVVPGEPDGKWLARGTALRERV